MNKFICFTLLLLPGCFCAQTSLLGAWKINQLVGLEAENEYSLTVSKERHIYGNRIELKPDGTFFSAYSAECGNDCFTTNMGKYEYPDENHIRFILEHVNVQGDCKRQIDTTFVQDLGLFRIWKDSSEIKLIKSDGNVHRDSLNAMYSRQIDGFNMETAKIYNLYFMPWKNTASTTVPEIVKDCLAENAGLALDNVQILFSKKIRSMFKVILLEQNGVYYYAVYDTWQQNVALYDAAKLP